MSQRARSEPLTWRVACGSYVPIQTFPLLYAIHPTTFFQTLVATLYIGAQVVELNPARTSSSVAAGNVAKKAPRRFQKLVHVALRKSLHTVLLNPVRTLVPVHGLVTSVEKYVAKSPCGFSHPGPLDGIAANQLDADCTKSAISATKRTFFIVINKKCVSYLWHHSERILSILDTL